MNVNKLMLPLVMALAAMLATTGCKHHPTMLTKLPGQRGGGITDPGLDPARQIPLTEDPTRTTDATRDNLHPEHFQTAEIDLNNYNQDRAALAAYTVHFDFDSFVVKDKEQANIASVAQALASDMNAKLLIEGHCDERGTEEYNRALGERRALALREALQKNGLDPARVKTISYGKDKPVDPGHSETAHAKNRRGEFVLLHPK